MCQQLTLEDFEKSDSEFYITEAPDFLTGHELARFNAKYVVREVEDSEHISVGDDGICRSFVGASFYYD